MLLYISEMTVGKATVETSDLVVPSANIEMADLLINYNGLNSSKFNYKTKLIHHNLNLGLWCLAVR